MTISPSRQKHRSKPQRVVGTGLVALDVLVGEGRRNYAALGGSAGNVLAILAFFGWSAVPVAQLGKDVAGRRIRSEFESLKADTRFIAFEDFASTPIVYQSPGEANHTHSFSFSCPTCGKKRGFVPATNEALCRRVLDSVDEADVFYFDRPTHSALMLAEAFRRRGTLVMFEPSKVGSEPDMFQRAINSCHILKYSDDRIDQLGAFDCGSVDVEIETCGVDGLRFRKRRQSGRWISLPALSVPYVSDTAGAGDWCSAGMLHSIGTEHGSDDALNEDRLVKALCYGQALAALNCMHVGARGLARKLQERESQQSPLLDLLESVNERLSFQWERTWHAVSSRIDAMASAAGDWSNQSDVTVTSSPLCCEVSIG